MPRHFIQGDKLDADTLDGKDGALFQEKAEKDQPSGFVGLDANGKATLNPTGARAGLNLKVLAADPVSPTDGDVWILDTGILRALRSRIAGVTYQSILGVL